MYLLFLRLHRKNFQNLREKISLEIYIKYFKRYKYFYIKSVLKEYWGNRYLCWEWISEGFKLSEDFIREYKDQVDWKRISRNQTLSKSFIREFKDQVDWWFISRHQTLSENFIKEFKDRVDWTAISYYKTLSKEFIREYRVENKSNFY